MGIRVGNRELTLRSGVPVRNNLVFDEFPQLFIKDPLELISKANQTGNDALFPDIRGMRSVLRICSDFKATSKREGGKIGLLFNQFNSEYENLRTAAAKGAELPITTVVRYAEADFALGLMRWVIGNASDINRQIVRDVPILPKSEIEAKYENSGIDTPTYRQYTSWIDESYGRENTFAAREHQLTVAHAASTYMLAGLSNMNIGGT